MQYRVEELAATTGVTVDTLRFYQGRGLIEAPVRQGRSAIYCDDHVRRIRQIRGLLEQGFSLAQIQRIPSLADESASDGPEISNSEAALLTALAQESADDRILTRAQLVAESGVPDELISAAQASGLLEAIHSGEEEHFSSADAELLRSGLMLLGAGFPLAELLALATRHAKNIQELCDVGIDLFDDHIRKADGGEDDPEQVATAFQDLMPQVTRLVAVHFQRTLVNRAIERLRSKGEGPALERALEAVQAARVNGKMR